VKKAIQDGAFTFQMLFQGKREDSPYYKEWMDELGKEID
jgi:hypothetical protein